MNGYVLSFNMVDDNTAASKPVQDITDILEKHGFKKVSYNHTSSKLRKVFIEPGNWKRQLRKITSTNFIFQYPVYSHFMMRIMIKDLKKRTDIYKIAIIHDLPSLRFDQYNSRKVKREIRLLNQFNCLIVHNDNMKRWLSTSGIKIPMVSLQIFDFLNPTEMDMNRNVSGPLVFAGNLKKANFLSKLNIKSRVILMGPNPSQHYPQNVEYQGQYSSKELPSHLKGSFGLVWDGTSPDSGEGTLGQYTKYNNPHKVSLYLSSGLPVIVWEKAAIAQFVRANHLGLVVSSLSNLDADIKNCSEQNYELMLTNVRRIGQLLREGYFTLNAMKAVLEKKSETMS